MSPKRIPVVLLALVLTLTCTDTSDPLNPDPQLAKGGIPGAPTDPDPVELLEYFVYRDVSGTSFVHILAKGQFPRVNLNVVQDYHFDGVRNNDLYYEYTTSAPSPVSMDDLPAGAVWESVGDDGTWHIDLPWDGMAGYWIFSETEDPVREYVEFPDFPQVELPGLAGDPYTFDIRFQEEDGDYIDSFRPVGIILNGQPEGLARTTHGGPYHEGPIYSYAAHKSYIPGTPIFIEDIIVDEPSITCQVKTVLMRDGKDKWRETVTELQIPARVILTTETLGGPIPKAWIDVMLATGDPLNPDLFEASPTTHGADAWAEGWGVSVRIPGDFRSQSLRLAVPYVYASDTPNQTVYTPSMNADTGGPGSPTGWFTINDEGGLSAEPVATEPVPFPIALTAPLNLNCGK